MLTSIREIVFCMNLLKSNIMSSIMMSLGMGGLDLPRRLLVWSVILRALLEARRQSGIWVELLNVEARNKVNI
jgi:hypothetical protein